MGKVLNIVNIWGIPHLVIENAGSVVDCPDYLGYSPVRVENNMNLHLGTIVMQFNMPKSDIRIHVWVV